MTLNELEQYLIAEGFIIGRNPIPSKFNDCKWQAYRRNTVTSTARRCECNSDKNMQIVVTPFSFVINGELHESAEIELCGEFDNWWILKAYGFSFKELITSLPVVEARLVHAWNALGDAP